MFIQKASQFNPHPDFSDPHLISSKIPLVHWTGTTSKLVDTKSLEAPNEEHSLELVGVNSASWVIVLENNIYSSSDIPSYLQFTHGFANTGTYNLPFLPNTFIKGNPEGKPLSVDVNQQVIEVELELSGIKQGQVSSKTREMGYLAAKDPELSQTTTLDSSNSEQNKAYVIFEWTKGNDLVMFSQSKHSTVALLFSMVVYIALICVQLSAFIWLLVCLLLNPVTRWIGMSRTTVAIMLKASALSALGAIAKYKILAIIGITRILEEFKILGIFGMLVILGILVVMLMPGFAITAFIAAILGDMEFVLWTALSQQLSKFITIKITQDVVESSPEQKQVPVA
ncbi:hypothetical protein GGH94_004241 [Coemansia aciculifera]|uniref:Uncharacterized protein n=1 Tax=Coemansia aciculifera TaxID=417176 RepID=A0A9W8M497_9FUNG|nr:hypothetical protein GGH94_004241 [Coemansia aciculifera]